MDTNPYESPKVPDTAKRKKPWPPVVREVLWVLLGIAALYSLFVAHALCVGV